MAYVSMSSRAEASLAASFARISSSRGSSSSCASTRLEEALHEQPHRRGAVQAARLHVEDRRLVELADGAAVRGGDVIGGDQHRGDRVQARLRREHHRVDLQVGVRLLGARVDLDQPLERRAALAGGGAAPVHVPAGGAGLVQVHREGVQVLVGLGEEQAAERHVAAGLGHGQLQVLAHEMSAQQRGQPVAVGVAPDADEAGGDVIDLAATPVLELREATARAVAQIQLERARVQRLTREVLGQVVLVHAKLARAVADDERAPVLRHAGTVDRVDDLERVLDDDARRHVQERPARPERSVGRLQLVAVDRQAAGVVLGDELAVVAEGVLQRAQDHAALGQRRIELDVHDCPGVLHDPPGTGPVGERARHDIRHSVGVDPRRALSPARPGRASAGSSSRTPSASRRAARR